MHNNFLVKIVIPPFIVLILHILATVLGWYEAIWWLDKPLHLSGGIAGAISVYYIISYFSSTGKIKINWWPLLLLAIFSSVALAVVYWEFMEFFFDRAFHSKMQGDVYDTITDMIMGMLGGTITGTLMSYFGKLRK